MHDHRIGSIVILRPSNDTKTMDKPENNMGIGIVTERDVVSYLGSDLALSLRTQISEIMSSPLITISIANSLKDAIEIMQQKNIRRLPVMDGENIDNKMVGIVTDKDILRAIMKTIPAITSAGQGERTDQTQSGYRFMYESYFTEDSVPKGTNLGV
jgi:CBS domain-containing protein